MLEKEILLRVNNDYFYNQIEIFDHFLLLFNSASIYMIEHLVSWICVTLFKVFRGRRVALQRTLYQHSGYTDGPDVPTI